MPKKLWGTGIRGPASVTGWSSSTDSWKTLTISRRRRSDIQSHTSSPGFAMWSITLMSYATLASGSWSSCACSPKRRRRSALVSLECADHSLADALQRRRQRGADLGLDDAEVREHRFDRHRVGVRE